MQRSKMYFLPGDVTLFGSIEQIIQHMSDEQVQISIEDFDFAVYDFCTGKLTVMDSRPEKRVFEERYRFTPGRAGHLHFRISSDLDHLPLIDGVIEEALRDFPVNVDHVGLSASEVVANAIQAANKHSVFKDIEIGLLYVPGPGLFFSVTDELGRLNLDELPDSFLDAAGDPSLETHGRGLLIIAALMEWLGYNPCQIGEGYKEILIKIPFVSDAKGGAQHE